MDGRLLDDTPAQKLQIRSCFLHPSSTLLSTYLCLRRSLPRCTSKIRQIYNNNDGMDRRKIRFSGTTSAVPPIFWIACVQIVARACVPTNYSSWPNSFLTLRQEFHLRVAAYASSSTTRQHPTNQNSRSPRSCRQAPENHASLTHGIATAFPGKARISQDEPSAAPTHPWSGLPRKPGRTAP
jgi:hypothetical protein